MKLTYLINQALDTTKFLLSYWTGSSCCPHPPMILMIEPTNHCNIKCIMCFRDALTRGKGFLSRELYERLLDKNRRIKRIIFVGSGETLLHPDLEMLIKYAAERNIVTTLVTNGTLLDEERARRLISSGINGITISLDATSKAEYEKLRRGADYDKVENNIRNFVKLRNKFYRKKLAISVNCVDFDYPSPKKECLRKNILSLGVDFVNFPPFHNGPIINKRMDFTANKKEYCGCILPWLMLTVLWDGRVAACCDDFDGKNIVGHLKEDILIDNLWNSRAICELRGKLAKNDIKDLICSGCHRIHKNPWKYLFFDRMCREIKEIFAP